MVIRTFENSDAFIRAAVDHVVEACQYNKETVRIALSGGGTPRSIYENLSRREDMPFERVELFQVDERYVSKHHPDSNQKMIRETLTDRIGSRLKGLHFFRVALPINEALVEYEKMLGGGWTFDLAILGIGPDGHTASLFPHSAALHESDHRATHTVTEKFAVKDRLTLTFPPILQSKNILVLLKGGGKKEILTKLGESDTKTDDFPAIKLTENKNLSVYYLR